MSDTGLTFHTTGWKNASPDVSLISWPTLSKRKLCEFLISVSNQIAPNSSHFLNHVSLQLLWFFTVFPNPSHFQLDHCSPLAKRKSWWKSHSKSTKSYMRLSLQLCDIFCHYIAAFHTQNWKAVNVKLTNWRKGHTRAKGTTSSSSSSPQ